MSIDIDAILERANAATPGPWGIMALHDLLRFGRKNGGGWDQYNETVPVDGDEEFIISARQDVPALCEYARAADARAERAEAALEVAQAKADVIGGQACAEARAAGRGPCGCCAWCVKQATERAERAEAALERARALAERWKFSESKDIAWCADELAALLAAAPGGAA